MTDFSGKKKQPEHIYVNISMHYTLWCSSGDFMPQLQMNADYCMEMFVELKEWSGAGVNLHFSVFDFESLKKYRPEVLKLLKECIANKSIELMKGGTVDYAALTSPVDDIDRHYKEWTAYVSKEFGIDTDGFFVWPTELAYHPHLPKVWAENNIGGIVLNPLHPEMKKYNFEPLKLKGEDETISTLISSINTDVNVFDESRINPDADDLSFDKVIKTISCKNAHNNYLEILEKGVDYYNKNQFAAPIISYAHDIICFEPKGISALLRLIKDDPLLISISLKEYAKIVKPRCEIYLDQGHWDTCYQWHKSSVGWFTQEPWHRHINGLSFCAYRTLKGAIHLVKKYGGKKLFEQELIEAEDNLLLSERSTARDHWTHPAPRMWTQEKALTSVKASQNILSTLSSSIIKEAAKDMKKFSSDSNELLDFILVNTTNFKRGELVKYHLKIILKKIKACNLKLMDANGKRLPFQVMNTAPRSLPCGKGNKAKGYLKECDLIFKPSIGCEAYQGYRLGYDNNEVSDDSANNNSPLISDNMAVLENCVVRIEFNLSKGGRISEYFDKETGINFLKEGNGFDGYTLDEAEIKNSKWKGVLITDSEKKTSCEVITTGPLLNGIKLTTELVKNTVFRTIEYYLEEGQRYLQVRSTMEFKEPIWFVPEWDKCGRLSFVTTFKNPKVQWHMPGGSVSPKEMPSEWGAFDFMGWVDLFDKEKGLAIIVKLFPNGPRMVCINEDTICLAISGRQRLEPYHKSSASYGREFFEFILFPHIGHEKKRIEEIYQKLNYPCHLFYDKKKYTEIRLHSEDENILEFNLEHFK